jgi:hypothetical protein
VPALTRGSAEVPRAERTMTPGGIVGRPSGVHAIPLHRPPVAADLGVGVALHSRTPGREDGPHPCSPRRSPTSAPSRRLGRPSGPTAPRANALRSVARWRRPASPADLVAGWRHRVPGAEKALTTDLVGTRVGRQRVERMAVVDELQPAVRAPRRPHYSPDDARPRARPAGHDHRRPYPRAAGSAGAPGVAVLESR